MHVEICPSIKLSGELDASSTANDTSILEEDLALSSSTLDLQDKSLQDQGEFSSRLYNPNNSIVDVNEETMDCNYSETVDTPKNNNVTTDDISSPEMFKTDDEDDVKNGKKDFRESLNGQSDKSSTLHSSLIEKCVKLTNEELIAKYDCHLLARMNKFLTGVPPPPKHTICQSDCADFLSLIRANRKYFLVDPLNSTNEEKITEIVEKIDDNEITTSDDSKITTKDDSKIMTNDDNKITTNDDKTTTRINEKITKTHEKCIQNPPHGRSLNNHRGKSSLRNLTNAFDACDPNDKIATATTTATTTTTRVDDESTRENFPENSNDCRTIIESTSNENICDKVRKNDEICRNVTTITEDSTTSNLATSDIIANKDSVKHVTFNMPEEEPIRFHNTIEVDDIKNKPWEIAYKHKTHGIHYNRSKTVEEFEDLTLKLCQRYIGAETQSSCNIWFTKQTPGSVKKRNLLSRRNNGQSPGKRLSHLARRRRTFSSANLQVLGMVDKKQLVLNIKKPTIRKGKSPRGKSPRGSAKKRAGLSRVSPSPRKIKLETSKRALFQSPPGDRAGPSNNATLSHVNTNSQQRIKRALFPVSKTKDDATSTTTNVSDIKKALIFEETKKRKSEDDLEGPRFKWAKSLSFDCAHVTESNSADSWTNERHSTGNFHMKSETTIQQGKTELSETHRKKLLWAVAEALRGKGIGMGHPRFKQCASQLARTVRKYMPDLENSNVPRKPGSTSDRMLRLAKRHVLLIVESRSTE